MKIGEKKYSHHKYSSYFQTYCLLFVATSDREKNAQLVTTEHILPEEKSPANPFFLLNPLLEMSLEVAQLPTANLNVRGVLLLLGTWLKVILLLRSQCRFALASFSLNKFKEKNINCVHCATVGNAKKKSSVKVDETERERDKCVTLFFLNNFGIFCVFNLLNISISIITI